jgi:hypothetical protein
MQWPQYTDLAINGMLIFFYISFADFLYHVVVLVLTLVAFDVIKDQIFSCDCVGICSH